MFRCFILMIFGVLLLGCANLKQMQAYNRQQELTQQEILNKQGYATIDCVYLGGQSCAIEFVDGKQVYQLSSGSPTLPSPSTVKFLYFNGKPLLGMHGVFSVMGVSPGPHNIGFKGISTPTGGQQVSFSFEYDFVEGKAYALYFYWEKRKPLLSTEGLTNLSKIPPFKAFITERGSKHVLKSFVSVSGSKVMKEDDTKIEENNWSF